MLTVVQVNNKNTRTMSCCIFFDFEHIQQVNLFLFLTLNMYLSVGHTIKPTKQLKCTLKNRASTCDMGKST